MTTTAIASLDTTLSPVLYDATASPRKRLEELSIQLQDWYYGEYNSKPAAWLARVGEMAGTLDLFEERSALAKGVILRVVQQQWDTIPLTERPEPDFKTWALRVCRGRDWRTIQNAMRVAEVFVVGAEYYQIPERVGEKPFDPSAITHSKLLVAAGKVAAREMTSQMWETLADPDCGVQDTLDILHNGTEEHPVEHRPPPAYSMEGRILVLNVVGESYEVLEFETDAYENQHNPAHRVVRAIMDYLGVVK